jgi:hypothetical protein
MRHVCIPNPVAGLAQGMRRATASGLLVPLAGTTELFLPRRAGAFG